MKMNEVHEAKQLLEENARLENGRRFEPRQKNAAIGDPKNSLRS
jgi:hypothetical protein